MSAPLDNLQGQVRARWAALAPREQRGVRLALAVLAALLVWTVLLAPALRTLQKADQQRAALDGEMDAMQRLQLRAQALQAQATVSPKEAARALQASLATLGTAAKLTVVGDQATLSLQAVKGTALAQWLAQSGAAVRLQPLQAHLVRDADSPASWSGTLVVGLPAAGASAK